MAHMKAYPALLTLTILLLISYQTNAVQYSTSLPRQQRFCFFEVFELNQKFTFVVNSSQNVKFAVEVSHVEANTWKSLQYRQSQEPHVSLRVDKLAPVSTTYSFCLKNMGEQQGVFKIQFHTGLDVLQLHNLPDATDADNLERQLSWLQNQTIVLAERSQNLQQLRRVNSLLGGMVGLKMIVFAVIGILVIGSVNAVFYKVLKGQLKKRKLI